MNTLINSIVQQDFTSRPDYKAKPGLVPGPYITVWQSLGK